MLITTPTNESSSQAYRTQEITKPSLVPETALANFDTEDDDIWIGDSGTTSHVTNYNRWMYQIKPIKGSVIVANGHKMWLESKGWLDFTFIGMDGSKVNKTLEPECQSEKRC